MLAQPRTILYTAVCLLGLGALLLGCGGEGADDAATPTTAPTTTDAPASSTTAGSEDDTDTDTDELFPDVIDASAQLDGDGTWTFNATLSSPYDSADRYADAWRVVGPDGTEYGIRVLTHDHASEQPFTRSHNGIEIPDDVDVVIVEGRDQVSGWGGQTFELELPR